MVLIHTAVGALLVLLFVAVGALLLYGVYAFRGAAKPAVEGARAVNLRIEVLWTAIAAALLLGVFLYAR